MKPIDSELEKDLTLALQALEFYHRRCEQQGFYSPNRQSLPILAKSALRKRLGIAAPIDTEPAAASVHTTPKSRSKKKDPALNSAAVLEKERYTAQFLEAFKGVPSNHVVAVLNEATPGINWARCSKSHMAESYATAKTGGRISLSCDANEDMRNIDQSTLQALRVAAIERLNGRPEWRKLMPKRG